MTTKEEAVCFVMHEMLKTAKETEDKFPEDIVLARLVTGHTLCGSVSTLRLLGLVSQEEYEELMHEHVSPRIEP